MVVGYSDVQRQINCCLARIECRRTPTGVNVFCPFPRCDIAQRAGTPLALYFFFLGGFTTHKLVA